MRHLARLTFIVFTVLRYGLDELALSGFRQRWVRALVWVMTLGRKLDAPPGQRLREALERLHGRVALRRPNPLSGGQ